MRVLRGIMAEANLVRRMPAQRTFPDGWMSSYAGDRRSRLLPCY